MERNINKGKVMINEIKSILKRINKSKSLFTEKTRKIDEPVSSAQLRGRILMREKTEMI